MGRPIEKIWEQIKQSGYNVRFTDFCRIIEWFGFQHKGGSGFHQTYVKKDIREIIDVQPLKGKAKPYQIRQLLRIVRQYDLKGGEK